MSGARKTNLMEQQGAVLAYLEDLLKEVPEAEDTQVKDNVVEVFPQAKTESKLEKVPPVEKTEPVELKAPVEDEPIPEPVVEEAPAVQEAEAVETEAQPEPATAEPGAMIPDWAEEQFQCLLFHVAGITLAVPLVKLNGVIPWQDTLTPMPGHSAAFLGLLRHLDKNVQVMDTAEVILPEAQRQDIAPPSDRLQKIILMDEGRWGLACDEIGEVITLEKADVRWRTTEGLRAWLAGTVSERLCALLDTDAMSRILADGMSKEA